MLKRYPKHRNYFQLWNRVKNENHKQRAHSVKCNTISTLNCLGEKISLFCLRKNSFTFIGGQCIEHFSIRTLIQESKSLFSMHERKRISGIKLKHEAQIDRINFVIENASTKNALIDPSCNCSNNAKLCQPKVHLLSSLSISFNVPPIHTKWNWTTMYEECKYCVDSTLLKGNRL